MDFAKLKQLVRKLGGLLVLDGDEPAFVVLSYDKYQKMEQGEEIPVVANGISEISDEETVERLNQEILALKEEIRQKEEAELIATEPIAEVVDPVRDSYGD